MSSRIPPSLFDNNQLWNLTMLIKVNSVNDYIIDKLALAYFKVSMWLWVAYLVDIGLWILQSYFIRWALAKFNCAKY